MTRKEWPHIVLVVGDESFKLCRYCLRLNPHDLARLIGQMPIDIELSGTPQISAGWLPVINEGHADDCPLAEKGWPAR